MSCPLLLALAILRVRRLGREKSAQLPYEDRGEIAGVCVSPALPPLFPLSPDPVQFFLACPRENEKPGMVADHEKGQVCRHPQGLHWAACIVLGAVHTFLPGLVHSEPRNI